jgi:hypothetical protein
MRGITSVCALFCIVAILGASPAFAQQQITSMTVPVVAVDNPQQLVSLNVVDPSGAPIGDVFQVRMGSDGKVSRVMVRLAIPDAMGRVAAVRPERLFFDRRDLRVVGQFSAAELSQLAATSTTPSGIDMGRSSGMVARPLPSSGDASPPMAY